MAFQPQFSPPARPQRGRWGLFALGLLLAGLPGNAAESPADTAAILLDRLQHERHEAGRAELERRAELDRVAGERAHEIAVLPHDHRLRTSRSIGSGLREAGISRFRRASRHVDMVRGFVSPAEGFLRSWLGDAAARASVLDPEVDAIGLAIERAPDGWVVLVAVLLEDLPAPPSRPELERRTLEAINAIRREHGVGQLVENHELTRVARVHSEDMLVRHYFDHRSPEGERPDDRVLAAGVDFEALAENIATNRGYADPVAVAERSWMESPHHREAILSPEFVETGVGVALSRDGEIYFTQLFMLPVAARTPR